MKHIKQTSPHNCGQACMAMLMQSDRPNTYWPIEKAEDELGKGKTSYTQLRNFLDSHTLTGFTLGPTTRMYTEDFLTLYNTILVRITFFKKHSHWVLFSREDTGRDGSALIVYDPGQTG